MATAFEFLRARVKLKTCRPAVLSDPYRDKILNEWLNKLKKNVMVTAKHTCWGHNQRVGAEALTYIIPLLSYIFKLTFAWYFWDIHTIHKNNYNNEPILIVTQEQIYTYLS